MNASESSSGRLPSPSVLAAFGVERDVSSRGVNRSGVIRSDVEVLHGRDEVSVRIGGVVLKRVQDAGVATWSQRTLASLAPVGWRVPRPHATLDGRWLEDGWTCTEFVDGLRPDTRQPERIVRLGVELADLLGERADDGAASIRGRTDRWATADRVAWAERDVTSLGLQPDVVALVDRLSIHFEPRDEPDAVVHGDLAGNVFLDRSGIPVILDVSPYIRPVRYGSAIVVVDHLLWFDGSPRLRDVVDDADALSRAIVFRVIAHQLALAPGDDHGLAGITPIVDALDL